MKPIINRYIFIVLLTFLLPLLSLKSSNKNKENNVGKITVTFPSQSKSSCFIRCNELYSERLDTLCKTIFWRRLMNTSKDTFLFYTFPNKKVIASLSADEWKSLNEVQKDNFRDSLRCANKFECDAKVMYMNGRNHFYDVEGVMPEIDKGIKIFEQQGVDPFYAQAILLIESPGKLVKSNAGAYGAFQLMRGVAMKYGLKVNKYMDERGDFDKSAVAASKLISTVCIPYTNAMLEKRNIAWCETDLWYRLLVLHVYHAGAGNVARALNVIEPTVGNMNLIKTMWQTNAGGFQNASQNYSQVAIASLLELDAIINKVPIQNIVEN